MELEEIKEACADWLVAHRGQENVDPGVIELIDGDGSSMDEHDVTATWREEDQ